MQVEREQCSLVLDSKTFKILGNELHSGMFYPINKDHTNWLIHLEKFVDGHPLKTGIPVVYGAIDPFKKLTPEELLIKAHTVEEADVCILIEEFTKIEDGYLIVWKFAGPKRTHAMLNLLLPDSGPFIISAITLVDVRENSVNVTQVVNLNLLRNDELAKPIRFYDNIETITINKSDFINPEITNDSIEVEMVSKLNLAAGNFIDYRKDNSVDIVQNEIKRQLNVDINECFELLEAFVTGDVSLMRDALADKRITLNGFQTILPFNLIKDYFSAVRNNFTRFDSNYTHALETQQKYAELEVPTKISRILLKSDDGTSEEFFVNKVIDDVTANTGEVFTKGKWVKSKYFENDNFKDIDGLFKDNNPVNISERYIHVRAVLEKLTNHLDEVYQKSIKS